MGLDRGQLDIQDLADLGIAAVGAQKAQHLLLRRRQRRGRGVPRLQVVRIIGRLNAGRTKDGLQKGRILHPIAFFQ